MNNYFNFCDLFRYYKFDVILLESFEFGGGGFGAFFKDISLVKIVGKCIIYFVESQH